MFPSPGQGIFIVLLLYQTVFIFKFQQQKKIELKETLLNELQEKKKVIESERVSMELTGGGRVLFCLLDKK